MTTVFAGMLIPSESVSVANTTFTSPASNSSSTVSLKTGSIPAWCAGTPVAFARAWDPLGLNPVAASSPETLVTNLIAIERHDVGVWVELALMVDVHRMHVVADQVVLEQRHGPALLDDHPRRSSQRADPLAELFGVGDRRR